MKFYKNIKDKLYLMVVYHKDHFTLEQSKKIFNPIQVGKANSNIDLEIQGDNTGDNISLKNPYYNELTALYWASKNTNYIYYGLMHYRRYFTTNYVYYYENKLRSFFNIKYKFNEDILDINYILHLLDNNYLIIPKKFSYNGQSVYEQYKASHHIDDLILVRKIINEYYDAETITAFDLVMQRKYLYPYNMFISNNQFVMDYTNWIFKILTILEERHDISSYDSYQKRVYGFLAERLFNVFIKRYEHKYNYRVKELPIIFYK